MIVPRLLAAALLALTAPALHADPVVENLSASQDSATKRVHVAYDLIAPSAVVVRLEISSDGGATWGVPATSASGDIGPSVEPGAGKAIVWSAPADWPESYGEQMRFRVVAGDDSVPPIPDDFVLIPGGSFTMGVTSGDTDADAPPTEVTVGAFYIATTETTKAQWDEVRDWAATKGYSDLPEGEGKATNHPVQTVSWYDVVKWCNARSEMEGLTPVYMNGENVMQTGTAEPTALWSADGYRLPTEAEWEKAARGGVEGKRFPWETDTISHAQANYISTNDYDYDENPARWMTARCWRRRTSARMITTTTRIRATASTRTTGRAGCPARALLRGASRRTDTGCTTWQGT